MLYSCAIYMRSSVRTLQHINDVSQHVYSRHISSETRLTVVDRVSLLLDFRGFGHNWTGL